MTPLWLGALIGCEPGLDPLTDYPVPDFELEDVNPQSASWGQTVSPRQHLDRVTAWYFGHAT